MLKTSAALPRWFCYALSFFAGKRRAAEHKYASDVRLDIDIAVENQYS